MSGALSLFGHLLFPSSHPTTPEFVRWNDKAGARIVGGAGRIYVTRSFCEFECAPGVTVGGRALALGVQHADAGREVVMKRNRGFSLIELLIVVAIILIIAAMAIPNLLRARIAANEASAANSVRKITTAEIAYAAAYPTQGYAPALTNLGGPANNCNPSVVTSCILDSVLSSGNKSGYQFIALGFAQNSTVNSTFVAGSAPQAFNLTGVRLFCAATDGVMRVDPGGAGKIPANTEAICLNYPFSQ